MTIRSYGTAIGRRGPEPAVYTLPLSPGQHVQLPWRVLTRGVAYFAAVLAVVYVMTKLPGIGEVLATLAFIPKWVALPGVVAVLSTQLRVDDRFVHVAAQDALLFARRPRRTSAGRPIRKGRIA